MAGMHRQKKTSRRSGVANRGIIIFPFAGRSFIRKRNEWQCERCLAVIPDPRRRRNEVLTAHVEGGACADVDRSLRMDSSRLLPPPHGCVVVCRSFVEDALLTAAAEESRPLHYKQIAVAGDTHDARSQFVSTEYPNIPITSGSLRRIVDNVVTTLDEAHQGWELRAGAVFVLKGGSKAQEIHLDWHKQVHQTSMACSHTRTHE